MSLYDYLTGIMRYRVKTERFEVVINRLKSSIPIKNIKIVDKNILEFTTVYGCRKFVRDVLSECSESYTSRSYGIPALFDRYKKRTGIWIGVLFAIASVYITTEKVWEVRVSGNRYVPDEDIIRTLEALDVGEGKKINKDILEDVYNRFLMNEKRISWISVNYDGTVANVEVAETKIVPEKVDRNKNINIVASCDGVVKRIDAFDGTKEVSSGDSVIKGQLLISSFNETRKTGVYMRAARGNVWAYTVHNYDIYINKVSALKKAGTTDRYLNKFIVMGYEAFCGSEVNCNYKSDISYSTEQIKLFGRYCIPVKKEIKIQQNFLTENVKINFAQAKAKAEKELEYRIRKDLHEAEITEKSMLYEEDDDGYWFSFQLLCIENIALNREFDFTG